MGRIFVAAVAALAVAVPASAAPQPIIGRWATDDGKAIVDIYACGAKLCGKVNKLLIKQPAGGQRDERNPDKAKRTRQVSGLQIYWDLAADGNSWKGQGYSPEDGRYYKAHLTAKGGKMTMKGCVAVFCRTVTWTKMG
ncbi:DUF2147 domain-containing protein [Sphingopyxis sp. PET50]|uniref:DUF2147 domain-containing protein n=1 Tax=Sphingopyxis sp. PET50 TaxID=2976533 RepID=UPI0021AFB929|nr:DUF2147 domain-containing protein [Sphingopyxis sp. PET50]